MAGQAAEWRAALGGVLALVAAVTAGHAAESYPLTPDSLPHDGVPKGETFKFNFAGSKIFPGTTREVTVYVPKQYDPAKPACVYVGQDGLKFDAPIVFDNLIAQGAMPVTIGVFSMPGVVPTKTPATALDRFNRSLEYDGLGDGYAHFLLDELLPAVETKLTADGRAIHLSHNGNDRAIGGASSGGVAAFTAAWERPDAFTRVFSSIGTYVGLRGGNEYPTLIRKTEPKPLRVFLTDGSNDLDIYGGDWWMANQTMERALTYAGYEVNHVWGDGIHSTMPGTLTPAIFPAALRWLWQDWPQPVKAAPLKAERLGAIFPPGEGWHEHLPLLEKSVALAVNPKGEVFCFSPEKTSKIDLKNDSLSISWGFTGPSRIVAFGPDGRLYTNYWSQVGVGITAAKEGLTPGATIIEPKTGPVSYNYQALLVARNGNVYTAAESGVGHNVIILVKPNGEKIEVGQDERAAGGLALSPDQTLLYLSEAASHWVDSYTINADGTLANRQHYYWLHSPDDADNSGATAMAVDRAGNLYVATRLGVQVCDQAGRVNCILPLPGNAIPTALCFGGEKFDLLYATAGGKLYQRKINVQGASAWDEPIKPPAPQL